MAPAPTGFAHSLRNEQEASPAETAECPEDFICPISLGIMSQPVVLVQTQRVYDHSSFHQWLTAGGAICPLTGIRLRNPIVLEPCEKLQADIQAWAAAKHFTIPAPAEAPVPPTQPSEPLTRRAASLGSEQRNYQQESLREGSASSPAGILATEPTRQQEEGTAPLAWVQGLAKSVWKGLLKKPQRPSTYMVTTSGVHRYVRGDLW